MIKSKTKTMTGKELQEAIASGSIVMKNGRYVSTVSDLLDFGPVHKQKAAVDPTPLKPVNMKRKFKVAKPNRKIMNATKIEVDDIKFDSKLEAYMYELLKRKKINFEMQYVIVLQPGFRDNTGKAIIAIKWKADFWLPNHNMIIDTKGWGTEIFKMKLKMFKHLQFEGKYPEIKTLEFPKNKNECLLLSVSL